MVKACDPAGPLFDNNPMYKNREPASSAALNVQCIHTSKTAGTSTRDCTQNWEMGNCGGDQQGSKEENSPISVQMDSWKIEMLPAFIADSSRNHLMCPYLYINAFEKEFSAVNNTCCNAEDGRVAVPSNYSMGYRQLNKGLADCVKLIFSVKNL